MKLLKLLPAAVIGVLLFSCKKDKTVQILEIPVESVSFAIKDIDLNERRDWVLSGGGQPYSFTIENDTLHAVPINDPYVLRFEKQEYAFNYIGFGLISPDYHKKKTTTTQRTIYATSPVRIFPNITDQSTEAKLKNADALIAINYKTPSGNIKDARFIHQNVLIDFETVSLPENAVVTVLQSEETKPFNYKPNFYKAIVVAVPVLSVKAGDETYKVQLVHPQGLSGNTHYTFKVIFDTVNKKLSIADLAAAKWSAIN